MFLVFGKINLPVCAYLYQVAVEIIWMPVQIEPSQVGSGRQQ